MGDSDCTPAGAGGRYDSPLLTMPKKSTSPDPSVDLAAMRYEDALAELEQLVARMEAGDLPLDDMLNQYRRGAQLLQVCRQRLATVEEQVKLLEDGELKPWRGGV